MAKAAVQINVVGGLDARALKQAQRELGELGKKAEGAGSKFSRISGAAAPVGKALKRALLPLGIFGALSVKAFREASLEAAQTAAVLKSTGGVAGVTAAQIDTLTSRIQKISPISDDAARAGANMLLTFTNIRNEAGKGNDIFNQATNVLADLSTAMGTDMKTSAIQLGKALNDPSKGLTALSRVGVTFTAEQARLVKGFVDSGQTAKAQAIILAELNKEFGGSAKAAGDAEGPLGRLRDQFEDIQEVVGGKLVGAFDFLARNMAVVGPILAGITAGFVAFKIAALAAQVVSLATGTTMAVAFGPIGLIIAAVVAVVVGLGFVIFRFRDQIGGALGAVGRFFTRTFSGVVRFLKQWGPVILAVLTGPIGLVILAFTKFRDKTFAIFRTVKDFILGIFNGIKGGLIAAMNWVIDNVINRMIEVANKVIRAINKLPGPNLPLIPRVGRIGGGAERGPTAAEITGVAGGRVTEFQRGGRVLGPVGAPQLAIVHGGEDILTAAERGRRGGGTTLRVIVNVAGSVTADRDLAATVRDELLRMRRRMPDLRLA